MLLPLALLASLAMAQQDAPTPPVLADTVPAAPAAPTASPEDQPSAAESSEQAEPEQVCRIEPVTGSRFGQRVCRGGAQVQEDRAHARQMLLRLQRVRTPDG